MAAISQSTRVLQSVWPIVLCVLSRALSSGMTTTTRPSQSISQTDKNKFLAESSLSKSSSGSRAYRFNVSDDQVGIAEYSLECFLVLLVLLLVLVVVLLLVLVLVVVLYWPASAA